LKFQLANFFSLGSPIGMFSVVADIPMKLPDKEGYCQNFFNVFHPNDLIAYRIEPLIPDFPNLNPEELPYIKNDGFKSHTKKKIVKDKISDIKEMAMIDDMQSFVRYDYVIQENFIENAFETLALIGGHFAYWDNLDMFYFVLRKIHTGGQGFPSKL
jgi:hypothetical protein